MASLSCTCAAQAIDGCESVQRVVCGGCLDFKVRGVCFHVTGDDMQQHRHLHTVLQPQTETTICDSTIICTRCCSCRLTVSRHQVITKVTEPKFGAWEATGFAPEAKFLEDLAKIDGITVVETQVPPSRPAGCNAVAALSRTPDLNVFYLAVLADLHSDDYEQT